MKKIITYLFVLILLLSAVSSLEIREGDKIIVEDEINENLYAAGGSITVDAPVKGDITAFGGSISVNSQVQDDLMVFGGEISLNGPVGGSTHTCGGNININSAVGGDLAVGGGNININGEVDGDIRAIGGNINLNGAAGDILGMAGTINVNGPIGGDIAVTAGEIRINGLVEGNVTVEADKLKLGKGALIKGNLNYAAREAVFREDQVGGSIFKEEVKPKVFSLKSKIAWKVFEGLALLLIGILLVLIMPVTSNRLADSIKENFWKTLLYGLAALIAVPIASALIAVTVIGIPVAILLILLYIITLFIAPIFAALLVGKLILKKQKNLVLPFILGMAIYIVLVSIPFIRGVVKLLAVLLGLGAITLAIFSLKKKTRKMG